VLVLAILYVVVIRVTRKPESAAATPPSS
jgi:hypothetical protein